MRHVALVTLGQLYLERRSSTQRSRFWARALDPPPSEAAALANLRFLLGRAYLDGDLADFDEAIWLFTQVLAVEPRSVEALNSRGLAYLQRGRPGDAVLGIADLERALDIEPERAATMLNLAVAYLGRGARGDVDRAIISLSEALDMQPDYASAYVNRASAYVTRGGPGDLERAFEDLEEALDIEPVLPSTHLMLGNAYVARRQDGDLQLAIADIAETELSRSLSRSRTAWVQSLRAGAILSTARAWWKCELGQPHRATRRAEGPTLRAGWASLRCSDRRVCCLRLEVRHDSEQLLRVARGL